jgi:hypothetical protein
VVTVSPELPGGSGRSSRPWQRAIFWFAVAAQLLSVLVVAFGDIGFDRPGRYGLAFDDLVRLALLWCGASCVAFVMARALRDARLMRMQWLVFALGLMGGLLGVALNG